MLGSCPVYNVQLTVFGAVCQAGDECILIKPIFHQKQRTYWVPNATPPPPPPLQRQIEGNLFPIIHLCMKLYN